MRIVAISDTHTLHNGLQNIPDGDVLIHAGDLTNHGSIEDVEEFDRYLGKLPHTHKIVIAGNHDFCFEKKPTEARARITNAIYLEDKGIKIDDVHFYGSPWQPAFFNWAFNLPRGAQLREKWNLIPDDTDVLITHSPPFGLGDRTYRGENVGCRELLKAVRRIKPKLHIFGHIHEAYGITTNEHTKFVNASSCNLGYQPINQPVVIDWNNL